MTQNDKLVEALEPFAAVADLYDDGDDDSHEVWVDRSGVGGVPREAFYLRNYRKAREALATLSRSDDGAGEAVADMPFVWMLRHKMRGEPYWNEEQCVWDNRYDAEDRADHEPEYQAVPLYAHPPAAVAGEGTTLGFYYPIEMPLTKDGRGPATIGKDAAKMTYQVWDQFCDSHGDFEFLSDAIRHAQKLNAALTTPPRQPADALREAFRPMDTWDRRDETVLLLVDYTDGDHPLDDDTIAITIGHNNDHNVDEDEGNGWQFAGWCWTHDHYVQGKGKPIGWMPLPHHLAALASTKSPDAARPPADALREALTEAKAGFKAVNVLLSAMSNGRPSIMVETFIERIDAALSEAPSVGEG